jgi:hypothetical protein
MLANPNIPEHGFPEVKTSRNPCCTLDSSIHPHVHSEIRNIKVTLCFTAVQNMFFTYSISQKQYSSCQV